MTTNYTPNPEADTPDRIAALLAACPRIANDVHELAATLADEDEAAYPGQWERQGFDRGGVLSEYLFELERAGVTGLA